MVHLEQLSVRYPGGVQALQPTTLSLDRGAFTVLLGPSGAGKSTLLRCLNGLVHPSRGRVVVDGLGALDNERRRRTHRRRTAMVFQSHQLIGRLSVLRNVLTGRLAYHGTWRTLLPLPRADRVLALHCLERVGLLELALRRADQLSGGQQQRVGVARALAQQPTLLLADEPVASLDPETARRVLAESDPFPQYPWTLRMDLTPELKAAICDAFLEMDDREVLDAFKAEGFAPISDVDYDVVRRLQADLGL